MVRIEDGPTFCLQLSRVGESDVRIEIEDGQENIDWVVSSNLAYVIAFALRELVDGGDSSK